VTPELSGFLAVLLFAASACAAVAVGIRRSGECWKTWLLVAIAKTYGGLFFGLRYRQHSPFPPGGALILVNHRSPVDPLFILATSSRDPFRGRLTIIEFLTATEYTRIPGAISFICRYMRSIPVDRDGEDMESAKVALRRMRAGFTVGIFPEGRINFGPGLLPPISGVAWLALKAGRPVIPAYIHGAPQVKSKSMVAPFLTRTRVSVDYGPPVDLSAYDGVRVTPAILSDVSRMLMEKLAETGGIRPSGLKLAASGDRVSA
jgi:1-acyl-sn-glycerol-3-phosphate acyltransferase